MRQVYTIGDTVYDIIFKNNQPIEARPGGAMLNTAISLSRLNVNVHLVADIAKDVVGKIIEDFLIDNNISTKYLSHYDGNTAKSRLALAFLDENNNADYSFYKIRTTGKAYLEIPDIKENDIVLFGSFFGIKHEIRENLLEILNLARKQNAIIIYDPNFRKAHLEIKDSVMPFVTENIEISDIVKGSDEDYENIYNTKNAEEYFKTVANLKCKNLIYTANRHGVWLKTANLNKHYNAQNITPVSTIGAGDTFNAGIIYSLIKLDIKQKDINNMTEETWNNLINTAIEFSSSVCLSYDNYICKDFLKKTEQQKTVCCGNK